MKNLFRLDEGHADIYAMKFGETVRVVNERGQGYRWDKRKKLWLKKSAKKLCNLMCLLLEKEVIKYKTYVCKLAEKEEDEAKKVKSKKNIQELSKMIKHVLTASHAKNVYALAQTKDQLYDPEFALELNLTPNFPDHEWQGSVSQGDIPHRGQGQVRTPRSPVL